MDNRAGLWTTVQDCGWPCRIVDNCVGVWTALQDCGQPCRIVDNRAGLWMAVQDCGDASTAKGQRKPRGCAFTGVPGLMSSILLQLTSYTVSRRSPAITTRVTIRCDKIIAQLHNHSAAPLAGRGGLQTACKSCVFQCNMQMYLGLLHWHVDFEDAAKQYHARHAPHIFSKMLH